MEYSYCGVRCMNWMVCDIIMCMRQHDTNYATNTNEAVHYYIHGVFQTEDCKGSIQTNRRNRENNVLPEILSFTIEKLILNSLHQIFVA